MDNKEKALLCHKEWNGKLETIAKSKQSQPEQLKRDRSLDIFQLLNSTFQEILKRIFLKMQM